MARGIGSTTAPAPRRSNRVNLGLNGRDVQLDLLGDKLVAPTRQKKRQFIPEDGLILDDNALAPAPKKKRRSKNNPLPVQTQPLPLAQSQPPQPLVDDGRYGFHHSPPPQRAIAPPTPLQPGSRSYTPLPSSRLQTPLPSRMSSPSSRISSPSSRISSLSPRFPSRRLNASLVPSRLRTLSPPRLQTSSSLQFQALSPPPPAIDEFSGSEAEEEAELEDIIIDERSEDEDDRRAHAFLQNSPGQGTVTPAPQSLAPAVQVVTAIAPRQPARTIQDFAALGSEESVLQNHYKRNHAPRAPLFEPTQAAPPSRKPPPPANPDTKLRTLDSYPPQWQEVITSAKRAFRAYVAGKCGFPDGVEGIDEARECLRDAVEVHFEEGGTLEQGYGICKDMWMIVFGESWQLRSQLKSDIRSQVRSLKSLFPDDDPHNPRSPREIQKLISDKVSSWTTDGSYLHGSVPNSDKQVHFGHPIIASTCKSFYFDRWSDIAMFDRDTFQGSVPKSLVALVGTVYRNVLDEWATGTRSTVKLESKHYTVTYNAIMDSIKTVDDNEHHGPALRQRLAGWAGFGASLSDSHAPMDNPVNIYLDLSPPST